MSDIILKIITKWLTEAYKEKRGLWYFKAGSGFTYIGDGHHFYSLPDTWIPFDFALLQHACPNVMKLMNVTMFHDIERDNNVNALPTGVTLDAPPKNKLVEFKADGLPPIYIDQQFLKELAYDKNRNVCNVTVHPENGEKKPVLFDFGDWQAVVLPVRRGGQYGYRLTVEDLDGNIIADSKLYGYLELDDLRQCKSLQWLIDHHKLDDYDEHDRYTCWDCYVSNEMILPHNEFLEFIVLYILDHNKFWDHTPETWYRLEYFEGALFLPYVKIGWW